MKKIKTLLWNTRINRRWLKKFSKEVQADYELVKPQVLISKNEMKKHLKRIVPIFFPECTTEKEINAKVIFLMALPKPTGVVTAVLNLPTKHLDCVDVCQHIRTDCTGNIYVPVDILILEALDVLILAYKNAHGPALKPAFDAMVEALNPIMAMFQTYANIPEHKPFSIVIIQSGNFHVKGVGGGVRDIWEATTGVAGEIKLTAVAGPNNCCHAWWYSSDGITWVMFYPTPHGRTSMSGLTPGQWAWFRHELIFTTGPSGVIQETKIIVGS